MSRRTVRPDTSRRAASSVPGQSRRAWSSDRSSRRRLAVSLIDQVILAQIEDRNWPQLPLASADNRPKGAVVLKRDGYIHGVPCWVDTNQPDPEAAVAFYGGLFGW